MAHPIPIPAAAPVETPPAAAGSVAIVIEEVSVGEPEDVVPIIEVFGVRGVRLGDVVPIIILVGVVDETLVEFAEFVSVIVGVDDEKLEGVGLEDMVLVVDALTCPCPELMVIIGLDLSKKTNRTSLEDIWRILDGDPRPP